MKKQLFFISFLLICSSLLAQNEQSDTSKVQNLGEIYVTTNRLPMVFKSIPSSVSVVTTQQLSILPKSIGVEEALRLVPGVRIDNQHDAERIHLSIRGQGILTERGLRGIGVLIDGIPVNDPSGFAPDLYDVDWSTVKTIEVLRGPAAGLYGGGSAAGVINIFTQDGGNKPFGGQISQSLGSNGFLKTLAQLNGSNQVMDYRISFTRAKGDGYRDHQAFWTNKLYEKINFHLNEKINVTQIISHTDYFQQNPEGLNIGQFDNLKQANPDACPFNEYQKTNRTTLGLNLQYKINESNDFQIVSYYRTWQYKETSNRCAEYRNITNPGVSAQYNFHFNFGNVKNTLSVGSDFKWQTISVYKLQSVGNPSRVESIDETNLENDSLLANQIISQQNYGVYGLYKFELAKFSLFANFRYDYMQNVLTNKMLGSADSARTEKPFDNTSFRIGASYSFSDKFNLYANYSQGFLPPSTEELANNPVGYSGFNTHLVPATSVCYEGGARGFFGEKVYYEITLFDMNTTNDFFRFKQIGRGNQEVFYGNAGNSNRKGIETMISLKLIKNLNVQVAYTYSDFKYTSATVDPIYLDTTYVLTAPPEAGQWLPNCPQHQLYAEIDYSITKNFLFSVSTEYQSKWAIYSDPNAYNGILDPTIYQNWQDGFNLYHARLAYKFNLWKLQGECSFAVRNILDTKYMAFTEPDPDGNSYHPGTGREFFGNIQIKF